MAGVPTPIRYLTEISNHIQNCFGSGYVLHEKSSTTVHVDIHIIAPTSERSYFTLLTSGMSDIDMQTPAGRDGYRLGELCLGLPGNWPLGRGTTNWKQPEYIWPIYILQESARYPHRYKTWLSSGHTIGSKEGNERLNEHVEFTGLLFAEPQILRGAAKRIATQ
jgi:Suppressor of fused protein (SUFU)